MAYVVPLTLKFPAVMERVYPLANLPVTLKVTVPDAVPFSDLSPTTLKWPCVLVMLMTCPTVRPGMADVLTAAALVALDVCWVAAKTGARAPDNARRAAKIPTVAPNVAIFVLVVFIFLFLTRTSAGIYLLGWNGPYPRGVCTQGSV